MEQSLSDIPVWFVCKICQESVNSINDFISHKRLQHFTDFQKLKYILFEENLNTNIRSNLNKFLASETDQPTTFDVGYEAVKQEIDDFEDTDVLFDGENIDDFEIHNPENFDSLHSYNENTLVCESHTVQPAKFLNSDEDEEKPIVDFEDTTEELKVKTSFSLNPVVRIQKLTPMEIQNACSKVTASASSKILGGKNDNCKIYLKKKPKSEPWSESSNFKQEASNNSHLLHQCPFCNEIFDSESDVKIHERICQLKKNRVTKVLKHECDVCLKPFKSAQILRCHKWIIHNNVDVVGISSKPVICTYPDCSKTFENERFLNCHKAKAHMLPSERKYVCKEINCGKAYKSNKILRYHLRLKHGKGKSLPVFTCEICLKTFSFSQKLQSHMLVHTDYRPFKCLISGCKLAFKRKLELERHGMTHQEKPLADP